MEITEIRIKLMEGSEDRLRAFCSITIDQCFVVRDLKIIDGSNGPFVAMPSRKLTGHCNRCSHKNHLRAGYCNHCGAKVSGAGNMNESPQKLYADVAHPINSECREMIQQAVVDEFEAELTRSRQPGYRSRYDDDFDAGDYDEADYEVSSSVSSGPTADPQPTASKAAESAPLDQSDPASSFGSGLLDSTKADVASNKNRIDAAQSDLDTPHFDAAKDSSSDSTTTPNGAQERVENIVRQERGNERTIPRPHFQDRRGGSQPSTVSTSPTGSVGGHEQPESDDDSTSDDSGFGAGILDD